MMVFPKYEKPICLPDRLGNTSPLDAHMLNCIYFILVRCNKRISGFSKSCLRCTSPEARPSVQSKGISNNLSKSYIIGRKFTWNPICRRKIWLRVKH